jgi:hypothetical protein
MTCGHATCTAAVEPFLQRKSVPSTHMRCRITDADLEAEVAQCAAHVALDVHQLALHELAASQQHPLFLGNQRLHMHRLEQADAHHLRYSACIVAVRLVDLLGLQQRLHVPRFHTHDRQVCLRQATHEPLE